MRYIIRMHRWLYLALALGGCANTAAPAETSSPVAPADPGAATPTDAAPSASCRMVVAVTGMT